MHMVILKSCKLPTWLHTKHRFICWKISGYFAASPDHWILAALRREVVLSCWDEEVEIALV
jgi:hypothetical protein